MLLRFAYEEFINEKEFENLTGHTMSAYQFLFSDFLSWCETKGYERVEELNSRALKSYLTHCKTERGNNPTSLNTKRKQFRTFFNFLHEEGIIDTNPTDAVKKVREDVRINTFTDNEVKQILSHLRRSRRKEDSFHAVRNYTVFLALIGTGVRVSELTSIKWSSVDLQKKTLGVFGKMRREEYIPLSESLIKELTYWRDYCEKNFSELSSHVFVNKQNEPLTPNAIKCFFKRLAKRMDFTETRCSPHSCRHYFAKTWIQNGGDISTLARVLRHSSIKTTEKYLHFWGNEVADDNEKYNPLSNILR